MKDFTIWPVCLWVKAKLYACMTLCLKILSLNMSPSHYPESTAPSLVFPAPISHTQSVYPSWPYSKTSPSLSYWSLLPLQPTKLPCILTLTNFSASRSLFNEQQICRKSCASSWYERDTQKIHFPALRSWSTNRRNARLSKCVLIPGKIHIHCCGKTEKRVN